MSDTFRTIAPMRTMIQPYGRRPMTPRMTAALPLPLCARSDARYFRAFRAGKPGPVHSDRNRGRSSTLEKGSIHPVMQLDGTELST